MAGPAATLRAHWSQYVAEASGLAIFMFVAGSVAALLGDLPEPLRSSSALVHRLIFGLLMGATAATLVYSPLGRRSGGHLNPAVTLTFYLLGKSEPFDAAWYAGAQFAGAALGLMAAALLVGGRLAQPGVHYIVTRGSFGPVVAFVAEFAIAAVLMTAVLTVSNSSRYARYTGLVAATLVVLFITFEAPLSGMSLNPARSLASALSAHDWGDLWIYFTAPPLGMLTAAFVYVRRPGSASVHCGKLNHAPDSVPCIFRCAYRTQKESPSWQPGSTSSSSAAAPAAERWP
jgi:aquaporin Z